MHKLIVAALAIMVFFVSAVPVFAVSAGKTVEFSGKGAGKVVFDGKAHAKAKCNECHPALFKMKKGATTMTMKDMEAGKGCGACHNGAKAFGVKDTSSCGKCHKK
ncbi:MAG: cytochrome c3 family protein [Nitrospiraceae bacterium]|nr:cytochrome c3 family protein [Nitrospiraceae bacterium]